MRKKKPKQLVKTNLDIFPIRCYDEDMKAFVLEDGSYLDIFERMADDVDNMLEDEVQYEMLHFARFLKTYEEDIKLLSMNFPTDTIQQQKAILERAESTNSPVKKKWLMRSLDELRRVDAGTRVREYYFVILSRDKEMHYENLKRLHLQGERLRQLSLSKKTQIIYKLCNPNSIITLED